MQKTIASAAVVCALAYVGMVNAQPASTVSLGYAQTQLSGSTLSLNPPGVASGSHGLSSTGLRGVNVKYHWESGNGWGIIGSYTYTSNNVQHNIHLNDNMLTALAPFVPPPPPSEPVTPTNGQPSSPPVTSAPVENAQPARDPGDIRFGGTGKSQSITVGPSWRFNDYMAVYALIGVGYSDMDIKDGPVAEGATNTSFAYGLGAQINPFKNLAIDVSYIHTRYRYDFAPFPATISTQAGTWTLGVGYRF